MSREYCENISLFKAKLWIFYNEYVFGFGSNFSWQSLALFFLKIKLYFLYLDDLTVGTEADKDTQTDTCDFSACNGFTLKTTVFENEITFGQCQFPFKGTEEDFFCFVNANSACEDKVKFDYSQMYLSIEFPILYEM